MTMDQGRRKKKTAADSPQPKKMKKTTTPPPPPTQPLPFQRTWTPNDEVRILEAMAAHRQAHGKVPTASQLFPTLQARLDRSPCTTQKLSEKMRTFMRRHTRDVKNGAPTDPHELRLYQLSKNVWLPPPPPNPPAANVFDKMRHSSSYPNLTQALMLLVDAHTRPADLDTAIAAIADTKAQALDLKVSNLKKELTQAILESERIQSTESPEIMCHPSAKLHTEFGAEIENNFPVEHLDETEGTNVKLASMEQEILELQQKILAFQSQPMADGNQLDKSSAKGIICESSESRLQTIVADNQILLNTLQTKMVIQQKSSCGKTKEVTSKHRNPQNLEIQKMMYRQRKIHRKNNDAGSQTKRNVELRRETMHGHQEDRNKEGGKEVLLLSTTWPHVPVAKATLLTSSGSTIVGGMPLRSECYEVFVNDVLKEDAPLLRPPGMRMAEALKSYIAWPRAQVQCCNNGDPVKQAHPGH